MNTLAIVCNAWGERWALGTLAQSSSAILFEYGSEALRRGVQFSPHRHPLRAEAYVGGPSHTGGLPGFLADALPDGWGLLLMDRAARRAGRDPATLTPLDRLALVGDRAIGALSFEPPQDFEGTPEDLSLLDLANKIGRVLSGRGADVLAELMLIGGSPHGARPKALVSLDPASGQISTAAVAPQGWEPWIIKYPGRGEHAEVCAIEEWYARLARRCGLAVQPTRHFSLARGVAAFGARRFDRAGALRVPVLSLAALLECDFRIPGVDVVDFLRFTRAVTLDESEVAAAFARCVFNVLTYNRDDHAKNFSYRMDRDWRWRLAPAYDLTFNTGPGGHHQLAVAGETRSPGRDHLLVAAERGGMKRAAAARTIDAMLAATDVSDADTDDLPIRKATRTTIRRAIADDRARLAP
ncbi:MAG: type II toxin-antitoxin system HipA family toxin [Burkholderiales bacterium]|nr:type II toxin-antitoxin system HipA family toxin [Burkholderiales bacterium]